MDGNQRAKSTGSGSDSDSSASAHPHVPDRGAGQKFQDIQEAPEYYSAHINSVCNAINNTQTKKPSTESLDKFKLARRRESNRVSARQRRQQRKATIKRLGQELRRLELESMELTAEKERLQEEFQREASGSFVSGTTTPSPMPHDNHNPPHQLFQQQLLQLQQHRLLQQHQLQRWQHFADIGTTRSKLARREEQRRVSDTFVAGTTNPLEQAPMLEEDQRPVQQQLLEQQSFLLQQHQLQLLLDFSDINTTASPHRSTQLSQQGPAQWLFPQQSLPLQHVNHQPPLQRGFPSVTPFSLASLARLPQPHVTDGASSLPYGWPNPHLDRDFERLLLRGTPPIGLGLATPSLLHVLSNRRDTAPPNLPPDSEDPSLLERRVDEHSRRQLSFGILEVQKACCFTWR